MNYVAFSNNPNIRVKQSQQKQINYPDSSSMTADAFDTPRFESNC